MSIACNLANTVQNSTFTCEVIASDDEASGGEGRIIVNNIIVKSIEKRHCTIGDISALYNHYKGNKIQSGVYLEAGLLTGNDKVMIGDVSKLYNFYRGNKDI